MSAKKCISIGQVFGRLTALSVGETHVFPSGQKALTTNCICECGEAVMVFNVLLRNGKTRSCGCLFRDMLLARITTHNKTHTPEHKAWSGMKLRCYNVDRDDFKHYGKRGIKVCERWLKSFENFIADMGHRPSVKHSIDRINNDGDYEPSNCRWATKSIQANNTRANRKVTIDGKTLTISEWSKISKIPHATVRARLARGWNDRDAVWQPRKSTTGSLS